MRLDEEKRSNGYGYPAGRYWHEQRPVSIDPFGLFSYLPSGTQLTLDGLHILTLADSQVGDELSDSASLKADVLVTHQGPLRIGRNPLGEVQGGKNELRLVKMLEPRFHVFGHHHHPIGPIAAGWICYIGVDAIVSVPRDSSAQLAVTEAPMAVLDSDGMRISFAEGDWPTTIRGDLTIADLTHWLPK